MRVVLWDWPQGGDRESERDDDEGYLHLDTCLCNTID